MKKSYSLLTAICVCLFLSFEALTNASGAPAGRSGSPASGGNTCASAGCHNGPAVSTQSISISSDIPSSGFVENTDYTITVQLDAGATGVTRTGFQASVESGAGHEGTITTGGNAEVRLSGLYVTHNSSGTAAVGNMKTYTFQWNSGTAPDQTTVYVAANFANNNGGTGGDVILTETTVLSKESGISLNEPQDIAVKMYPNPASEMVHLENVPTEVNALYLLNLKGQRLSTFTADTYLNAGVWTLPLETLPAGQYFIRADTPGLSVQKLQVTK